MDRAVLNASRTAQLAHANRLAYFRSAKTLPFRRMATLSAPAHYLPAPTDPLFSLQNDKIAFQWFETIEKDLHFLQAKYRELSRAVQVRRADMHNFNYAQLISPEARKIFIGEEHRQPAIYQAFETLVLQYQQRFPTRRLMILTEFVSDRLFPWQKPGLPVGQLEMFLRRNNADFAFFNKLIQAGIPVIGLENIRYIKDHEALITPSESQYESVYCMQERNPHWRQIINYVSAQYPDAVLFIYTGSMHTHYRAPFTLSSASPQHIVLQLEAGTLGADMPFGYVMKNSPLVRAQNGQLTVLSWGPKDPVFRTRSGFDACIIFPQEKK